MVQGAWCGVRDSELVQGSRWFGIRGGSGFAPVQGSRWCKVLGSRDQGWFGVLGSRVDARFAGWTTPSRSRAIEITGGAAQVRLKLCIRADRPVGKVRHF